MKRRKLLKMTAPVSGLGMVNGVGAAAKTDGSFYDWCSSYIEELEDSGLTTTEAHDYFEAVYNVGCSEVDPGPTSSSTNFPISACASVSLAGNDYCLETGQLDDGTRDCGSTTRYPDYSVDVSFKEVELYGGENGEVHWEHSWWIGVRENPFTGDICLEIGNELHGICFTNCTPSGDPTVAELADAAEELVQWADDHIITKDIGVLAVAVIAALIISIIKGLLCSIGAGTGC